mmetsp:Transcript_88735/g.176380  ORF Transcript_88735/g.176380 Transcript_88735/m.176380 type:complete len:109 (-) Transcript_88735:1314-1640(-)
MAGISGTGSWGIAGNATPFDPIDLAQQGSVVPAKSGQQEPNLSPMSTQAGKLTHSLPGTSFGEATCGQVGANQPASMAARGSLPMQAATLEVSLAMNVINTRPSPFTR